MSHSPEPWVIVDGEPTLDGKRTILVNDANGKNVMTLVLGSFLNDDQRLRDMQRIVRCINAGRDLSDQRLDECIAFNEQLSRFDQNDMYSDIAKPEASEFDPLVPLLLPSETVAVEVLEGLGYTLIPPLARALKD